MSLEQEERSDHKGPWRPTGDVTVDNLRMILLWPLRLRKSSKSGASFGETLAKGGKGPWKE
ncbi:MAG: hypothetical protein WC655_11110, partial [Candidatus Hydrogenedentales bacterium]